MYQSLDGERWRHIWLVGDLHGCLTQLASSLRDAHFDPWQDLLIAVGDLIDRGDNSPGCLSLLDKPWFYSVQGNHEQMAIDALENGAELWRANGGEWFDALSAQQRQAALQRLRRCRRLPLIIELRLAQGIHIIAHADYPASRYAWQQPLDWRQVVWSRARLMRNLQGKGEKIHGADHFWFGHTPLKRPLQFYNQHYIDTGAVFGNTLTLIQIC
ncbi:metallophosphoesterase [Entomohabitans teleogrylli]|uniref:metallophosphoesterase n=1 Tax=Entomohabitans teleogrylli TaxID=1384589 RepID=UPI00073DB218|nr:metallophosphoesterase [Entomohabitans teleogrylli]